MTPELQLAGVRATIRQSFYAFTAFIASITRPGEQNMLSEATHYPLCRYLQDIVSEGRIRRVHTRDPRNHLKSTIYRAFVLWYAFLKPDERYDSEAEYERAARWLADRPWIRGPDGRICWGSASKENAMLQAAAILELPEVNPVYRAVIPEHCPEQFARAAIRRVWNSEEFTLPSRTINIPEPYVDTKGIESRATSRHYDIFALDDPVTETSWKSAKEIQTAIDYILFIPNLLEVADTSKPNASLALINGNMWTYYDTSAYIEENLPAYDIWHRAAWTCTQCGRDRCVRGPNCEPTDEPLWPERWTRDGLLALRREAPRMFAAQYENNPMAGEAVAIDSSRLRECWADTEAAEVHVFRPQSRLVEAKVPFSGLRGILSLDPATSTDPRSCRSAIALLAEDRATQAVYLIDLWAEQREPGDVIAELIAMYVKWRSRGLPIAHVGFESVAGQKYVLPALISEAKLRAVWPLAAKPTGETTDLIQLYKPDRNEVKEERIAKLLQWRVNNSLLFVDIHLPKRNLWESEITRFPASKSNDILDAVAYAEQLYARQRARREEIDVIRKGILQRQLRAARAIA